MFRRLVPRPARCHAAFERLRDQASDLLALQRHELLVRIVAIELRAEVDRMDSRVVAVDDQEMLGAKKNVVFPDYLAFLGGAGNAQPLRRRPHDGAGLEQDHPVLLRGIVPMDRDVMARRASFEKPHESPMMVSRSNDRTKE